MNIKSMDKLFSYELKSMIIEELMKDSSLEILHIPHKICWEIKFSALGKSVSEFSDIYNICNTPAPEMEEIAKVMANAIRSGFKI